MNHIERSKKHPFIKKEGAFKVFPINLCQYRYFSCKKFFRVVYYSPSYIIN